MSAQAKRKGNAGPRKHIPQRTCIGCGQVQGKREMLRVVRTLEGPVEIDPTGKRNGRGAYVHRTRSCWDAALGGGRLAHALKVTLSDPDRQALEAFAASLPAEESADKEQPTADELRVKWRGL